MCSLPHRLTHFLRIQSNPSNTWQPHKSMESVLSVSPIPSPLLDIACPIYLVMQATLSVVRVVMEDIDQRGSNHYSYRCCYWHAIQVPVDFRVGQNKKTHCNGPRQTVVGPPPSPPPCESDHQSVHHAVITGPSPDGRAPAF